MIQNIKVIKVKKTKTILKGILVSCIALLGLNVYEAQAQNSAVIIDSIWVGISSHHTPEDDFPPSVDDPAWNNRTVSLDIVCYIENPSQVSLLQVNYGTTTGASDLLNINVTYLLENGKEYFQYKQQKFPIAINPLSNINKLVILRQTVPVSFVKKTAYATVRIKDTSNLYSNTITRKFKN